jgi:hypothetical protein
MTRFSSFKTILIVSLLAPLSGYTQDAISRCNIETGSAVFSDAPCANERETVPSVATRSPAAVRSKAGSQANKFFAAEESRTVAFGNRPLTTHRLPRDEATLKSARTLTTSMEEMPVSQRRQMQASFAVYP